jgi:LacI family transcriptional regulator
MARSAVDAVLDDSLRVPGSRRERVRQFPSRLVVRGSCGCGPHPGVPAAAPLRQPVENGGVQAG